MQNDESEVGRPMVRWHSSEEDSGPDVGMSLRLSSGSELWCGEITHRAYQDAGDEAAYLGGESGWWIILYSPQPIVIGKCLSADAAETLLNVIAGQAVRAHLAGEGRQAA